MKKSMLKQSVIALVVGSVISGASVAADTTAAEAAAKANLALKEEIKSELRAEANTANTAQNEKINKINSRLNGVATNSYNNTLTLSGFKAGDDVYDVDPETGKVTKKAATVEDVNNDPLEGKGVVATVIKNKDSIEDLSEDLAVTDDKVKELADHVKKNREDLISANTQFEELDKEVSELTTAMDSVTGEGGLYDIVDKHSKIIDGDGSPDSGLVNVINKHTEAINKLKEYNSLDDVTRLVENKADKADLDKKADIGTMVAAVRKLEEQKTAISDNKAAIATNTAKIADNASKIAENRKDINKNALRIQDTRNKQFLQNARLDNHGERIEANKAAIGDLATATDKAVKNLGDAVRDLDEDLAGTQDAVAENRKDIDKNASRITDTRNKQVLQNARLDNHGERIDANKAAIADNASKIATNELKVSENRKDIDKNASRITDTRNKQVLQNARLDNHGQRIDANKAAIATNVANIATNTAAVATNTAAVATNRANIATNTAAIAAHNQRLDHLDNRVNKLDKDLKRGLAAQAALTGLFQPYTVGKVNFTAAVGGYKSQTAVAIGTGYRYNQNIATKAGVAFTQGGGVTYNAGVNFEW